MDANDITQRIVNAAYRVHQEVGPGLLESVYEAVLASELEGEGLSVARQVMVPVTIRNKVFDEGFRADLIVENQVLIELKSVEQLSPVHKKQVFTYLKFTGLSLGLLINFGGNLLKGNIERIVKALRQT